MFSAYFELLTLSKASKRKKFYILERFRWKTKISIIWENPLTADLLPILDELTQSSFTRLLTQDLNLTCIYVSALGRPVRSQLFG